MNLTADIDGHGVSLRLAPAGYMDAAIVHDLAGLEVEIAGELRVYPRDDGRKNILSLAMTPAHMAQLVVLLAERTELPAFTEREWHIIAGVLRGESGSEELVALADRIEAAYR